MNKKILVLITAFVMLFAFAGIASAGKDESSTFGNDIVDSSKLDEVESITFSGTVDDYNWGWVNGQLYFNGKVDGWYDFAIGPASQQSGDTNTYVYNVFEDTDTWELTVTDVNGKDVATWLSDNIEWFQIGVNGVYAGDFTLTSVVVNYTDDEDEDADDEDADDEDEDADSEDDSEDEDAEEEDSEDTTQDAEDESGDVISDYLRSEDGIYRINIYNSYTDDDNDMIIEESELDNIKSITVTFVVDGLAAVTSDACTAYIGGAVDGDWLISYWGGEAPEGITVSNATVNEDGTYTVTISFDDESARTAPFLALYLDAAAADGDVDTTIGSGLYMAITGLEIEHYETEAAAEDEAPKTADAMNVVVLGFVAVMALAGVAVAKKNA